MLTPREIFEATYAMRSAVLFTLLLLPLGFIAVDLSAAQAAESTFSSQYELDPDWPRLPADWKLGPTHPEADPGNYP